MPEIKNDNPNPEDMLSKMVGRFKDSGLVMPQKQRVFYETIAKKYTFRTIVDIECGLGIGSNIMAHGARFVWGTDVSDDHIKFARQMFNQDNLNFDVYDVESGEVKVDEINAKRQLGKFEVVTCIEVLEHITDYQKAINNIKQFYTDKHSPEGTVFYFSTPNYVNELGENKYHVNQWKVNEWYDIMVKNFKFVVVSDYTLDNLIELSTKETPIFVKCERPL
jgi:2-polyprenyl-3-methyl-5-hydroxy-6-metoxy-1,4-benzoquinol methylase